jgi:hypothetical protein
MLATKLKQRRLMRNWSRWHMHTGCLKLFTLQPNLVWLTTSRRILEFPLGMDAGEVAKELKRQDCMLGPQIMKVLSPESSACVQRRETEERLLKEADAHD